LKDFFETEYISDIEEEMKNFFAKTKGVSREFVYFNAIVRENLKNEETIDLENIENDTEKKRKGKKKKEK